MKRYTIAVDFDGVLHEYSTPWLNAHTIPDPPIDGAIEWLHRMIQKFDIVIFTTRGRTWRGRFACRRWLKQHAGNLWNEAPESRGIEDVRVTDRKPAALIYLDDRAYRFNGVAFPTADEVHAARPWHKQRHVVRVEGA